MTHTLTNTHRFDIIKIIYVTLFATLSAQFLRLCVYSIQHNLYWCDDDRNLNQLSFELHF
ncbi:CLUMA_CG018287, isoform A [Clunio marinus]|uniref:CLUMA_CG018287, isoform A n=1 Tax=Clunio marinus TaxID=568069 RepID=A0A1J1J2Q3_9DIPT|nr:CLUMA_CG018287, isoform A [Clunio marinus]